MWRLFVFPKSLSVFRRAHEPIVLPSAAPTSNPTVFATTSVGSQLLPGTTPCATSRATPISSVIITNNKAVPARNATAGKSASKAYAVIWSTLSLMFAVDRSTIVRLLPGSSSPVLTQPSTTSHKTRTRPGWQRRPPMAARIAEVVTIERNVLFQVAGARSALIAPGPV
jgi:hypothetical protein